VRERSEGGLVTGFFIGALLGVGVAALVAPEGGEGRVARVRELYVRGKEIIEAARSDLGAAVDEAKAAAHDQRKRLEALEKQEQPWISK
jgi:gas vesicle protein